jgi:spore coat protein U-like protein
MFFKKSALVLTAALLAMSAAQAVLPTVTTNVPISIVVSTSNLATACTVTLMTTGSALTYISGSATASIQYRNANISCNGNDAITYTVSAGAGLNAGPTSRRAASGVNFIDYNLTSMSIMGAAFDSATAPLFGGSAITATTFPSGLVSTSSVSFQVNVPAGQTPASGTYTDTVVLTTTF